jgi:hypothetical protein
MANLEQLLAEHRNRNGSKAPMPSARTETLKPEAYLEEAEGKPLHEVLIGLRTPNDEDYCKAQAAEDDHAAMLAIVSVGICDPNDCRRSHPSFPFPDQQIPNQLKPQTIRYLFDQIERLHIESSPAVPLATDEELFLLGDALQNGERLGSIEQSSIPTANRIRRLATAIIESLGID